MQTSLKPVIGLTVSEDPSASFLRLPRSYSSALLANGAFPLFLPLPLSPENCNTIVQRLSSGKKPVPAVKLSLWFGIRARFPCLKPLSR